ncbi:DUF5678 domain-containing protein [Nostoc sp. DSM 114161]|jgi:hypothetical protein|uniref:hypothetical protein n=1 Tax=Nostoc sp. DSM 114161 TaxID=3440143 RepID=UPI0040465641
MTDVKPTRPLNRGRIFPEFEWSPEQKAQRQAERNKFHQRCKEIFDRVQPELIKNYYNWYMVVEPDSGDYFIDSNEEVAMQMAHQKHPGNIPLFLFRINETGISGTI